MLIALLACGTAEPGFQTDGTRTDLDDAGGSATPGGDDTAGGTDTASDTASDTGSAECGASDLVLTLVVDDGTSTGTAFVWPVDITTRAVFTNPCAGTLAFQTPTSCLVDTWTLVDGAGQSTSFSGNCVDSATSWTLGGNEATSVTATWGVLDQSTYQVTARADVVGRSVSEFFSVQ